MALTLKAIWRKKNCSAVFDGSSLTVDDPASGESLVIDKTNLDYYLGLIKILFLGRISVYTKNNEPPNEHPIEIFYDKNVLKFIDPFFFLRLCLIGAVSAFTLTVGIIKLPWWYAPPLLFLLFHQAYVLHRFLFNLHYSTLKAIAAIGVFHLLFCFVLFYLNNDYAVLLLVYIIFFLAALTLTKLSNYFYILQKLGVIVYLLLNLGVVYVAFNGYKQFYGEWVSSLLHRQEALVQKMPCQIKLYQREFQFDDNFSCHYNHVSHKIFSNTEFDVYSMPFIGAYSLLAEKLFLRGKMYFLKSESDTETFLQMWLRQKPGYFYEIDNISNIRRQNIEVDTTKLDGFSVEVLLYSKTSRSVKQYLALLMKFDDSSDNLGDNGEKNSPLVLAIFDNYALKDHAFYWGAMSSALKKK